MTQRIDVRSDDGMVLLNQLVTNTAMRSRVWKAAAAGRKVTISPSKPKPPLPPPPPPPPPPPVAAPYGTKADAGVFAGRGIMLGSNPDVWAQAFRLAHDGYVEVVACIPSMPAPARKLFTDIGCHVATWCPPEVTAVTDIFQAESQAEWDKANHLASGACVNDWRYGPLNNYVALVECYFNEGWGVDFGIYRNYMAQGAKAVIPVCGGYHANGRSDAESARLYAALGELPFPGLWMFAGESMLTAESADVLKNWRAK